MLKWAVVLLGALLFAVEKYGEDEVLRQLPVLAPVLRWMRTLGLTRGGSGAENRGVVDLDAGVWQPESGGGARRGTFQPSASGGDEAVSPASARNKGGGPTRVEDIAPPALCRYWQRRRELAENPDARPGSAEFAADIRIRRRKASQAGERHKAIRARIEASRVARGGEGAADDGAVATADGAGAPRVRLV